MPLKACDGIWGGTEIVEAEPAIELHREAVYLPIPEGGWFDTDPSWGIYDAAGVIIPAAAYYRNGALCGQSHRCELGALPIAEAPDETYVYGGPMVIHYGHFLCATLPRFWFVPRGRRPAGTRILCHGSQRPEQWFQYPFIAATLGALGLGPQDFASFDRPTRIRRLIVPWRSFGEQEYAHRVLQPLVAQIGSALVHPWARLAGRPVYLSRRHLAIGTTRLLNEDAIEAEMERAGIEIVHPETLPLAEQVRLFVQRRVVIGQLGSAFHTSMLSPPGCRMVGLLPTASINSNFPLLDTLLGHRGLYFHPAGEVARDGPLPDGFHEAFRVGDPRQVGQALVAAAEYAASLG